jgi:hypothetical protein
MFTIFHKKPEITLDCFISDQVVFQTAPVKEAFKDIPSWWNNLPTYGVGTATEDPILEHNLRRCYGFVELYRKSFVLENWSDINIKVGPEAYSYWYAGGSKPQEHPKHQYAGGFSNYHHIKMVSPWYLREKSGIQFAIVGAEWSLDKFGMKVLPGFMEFKINATTNINIMLEARSTEYEFHLPLGQPLVYIIPLTEQNVVIKNHLVTPNELEKIKPYVSTFRPHNWLVKMANKVSKQENMKCPFK